MKKVLLVSSFVLCLLLSAQRGHAATICGAVASNLVSNCGFETGDFASWTLAGNDVPGEQDDLYGVEGVDPFNSLSPNSGASQAYFGDLPSNPITISQALSTLMGSTYTLTFYLAQDTTPAATGNSVIVSFGGVQLGTLNNVAVEGYTKYTYNGTASGASSVLSLTFGNDVGYFNLDDVSVTQDAAATSPVPEPSSMALLSTGLAGLSWIAKRRKLVA